MRTDAVSVAKEPEGPGGPEQKGELVRHHDSVLGLIWQVKEKDRFHCQLCLGLDIMVPTCT